jgi:formamidopyrimidine-DNA glycosylase
MHRMHNDPKTSSGPETTGRTIHWASQQGSIDAGVAPFELNLCGQKQGWDGSYLLHWEDGAPCQVCPAHLVKIRTGSTGSYICPGCQPLEPK